MVKALVETMLLSSASSVAVEVIEPAESTIRCAADDAEIKNMLEIMQRSMVAEIAER